MRYHRTTGRKHSKFLRTGDWLRQSLEKLSLQSEWTTQDQIGFYIEITINNRYMEIISMILEVAAARFSIIHGIEISLGNSTYDSSIILVDGHARTQFTPAEFTNVLREYIEDFIKIFCEKLFSENLNIESLPNSKKWLENFGEEIFFVRVTEITGINNTPLEIGDFLFNLFEKLDLQFDRKSTALQPNAFELIDYNGACIVGKKETIEKLPQMILEELSLQPKPISLYNSCLQWLSTAPINTGLQNIPKHIHEDLFYTLKPNEVASFENQIMLFQSNGWHDAARYYFPFPERQDIIAGIIAQVVVLQTNWTRRIEYYCEPLLYAKSVRNYPSNFTDKLLKYHELAIRKPTLEELLSISEIMRSNTVTFSDGEKARKIIDQQIASEQSGTPLAL